MDLISIRGPLAMINIWNRYTLKAILSNNKTFANLPTKKRMVGIYLRNNHLLGYNWRA